MEIAVLALLWAVVLWRGPSALRSRKQRALWITFAALTVSMTLRRPEVMDAIDGGTGVNNLSTLVKHVFGITAAAALLEFVFGITRPEGRNGMRMRLSVAVGTIVAMSVLFAWIPRESEAMEFYESHAGSGAATAYLLFWYVYLGIAMAVATVLFWGAGLHAGAGWLRTGLRLLGAGTAAGVGYALVRAGYLVLRLIGPAGDDSDATVSTLTDVAKHGAIVLILIGSSVPAVGVAWRAVRHWLLLHRLSPLWSELTAAVPEVVLDEAVHRRELRMRLHRRVVEIRDATLALEPYVPAGSRAAAEAAAAAAGLDERDRRATAEACRLEAGRRAKLAGRPPFDDLTRGEAASDDSLDLEAEARWLWRIETARGGAAVRHFVSGLPKPPGEDSAAPAPGSAEEDWADDSRTADSPAGSS